MSIEDPLRAIVRQAISTHPAGLARTQPTADEAERHRAAGAYHAYLNRLALALGVHHPTGPETAEDSTAWRAVSDAVLSQAATVDEPDLDATQQALRSAVSTQPVTAHRLPQRPMSMQERILAALTDLAQRAGRQVSIQPQYANTGRVYVTAADTFAVQVELSYHFDIDYCGPHFQGPAIDALEMHDSPPDYRDEHSSQGGRLSYYALRYADGERITAMLDLIATALQPGTQRH